MGWRVPVPVQCLEGYTRLWRERVLKWEVKGLRRHHVPDDLEQPTIFFITYMTTERNKLFR